MMEDDAATVATATFFRALRREWAARNLKPAEECPIPDWHTMAALDRQPFVRSMKIAIASAKPDNVAKVIHLFR